MYECIQLHRHQPTLLWLTLACYFQLKGKRPKAMTSCRHCSGFALWPWWQLPGAKSTAGAQSLTSCVIFQALSWEVPMQCLFVSQSQSFRLLPWAPLPHITGSIYPLVSIRWITSYDFSCQCNMVLGFASNICWVRSFFYILQSHLHLRVLRMRARKGVLVLIWSCIWLDQPTDPAEKRSAAFPGQVFNQISLLTCLVT